jgi:hypothetical protein
MHKLCAATALLSALLIHSVWAQDRPVPNEEDEGIVPRAFFTGAPIAGRIECDRSSNCSATNGLENGIFWNVDMRTIPYDQNHYISVHCGYNTTRGCAAHYQIFADFPFLNVVQVTLDDLPLPSRR